MKTKRAITKLFLLTSVVTSCSKDFIAEIPPQSIVQTSNSILSTNTPTEKLIFETETREKCQGDELLEGIEGLMIYLKGSDNHNSDVYIMDMNSGEEFRITEDPAIDDMPSISNDGKKIAFTSNRRGDLLFGLYVMEISELHSGVSEETINPPIELVMPGKYEIYWPTWSPIGNWIAYSVRKGVSTSYIDIINYDSLGWWRINSKEQWNDYALWAPNTNRLYIINNDEEGRGFSSNIQQIDMEDIINNNQPKQIFTGEKLIGFNVNANHEILLSQYIGDNIKIMKLSPGEDKPLIILSGETDENVDFPIWSPDNNWIAYRIWKKNDNTESIHIYNTLNDEDYGIFSTNTMVNIDVVWSKDSKYISYIRMEEKGTKYYLDVVSIESLTNRKQGCDIVKRSYGPINTWKLNLSAWINNTF